MSNLQAIADRVEIEALRGEFTDAGMMDDYDRLASLFTQDGLVKFSVGEGVAGCLSGRGLVRGVGGRGSGWRGR